LPTQSIDDPIVPHDQLTNGVILILRYDTAQLRVTSKLLNGRNNALSRCRCIRGRVFANVIDDLSQILTSAYRPAD